MKPQIVTSKFLRSQIVILEEGDRRGLHVKFLPYVFTEQGVAMLSSVLKSEKAIKEIKKVEVRSLKILKNLYLWIKEGGVIKTLKKELLIFQLE